MKCLSAVRLWFVIWTLLCLRPAIGQEPAETDVAAAPPANSAAGQLVVEFERVAPKVGDAVPSLTVLDADGQPFDMRTIKGDYAVLVFGCLT